MHELLPIVEKLLEEKNFVRAIYLNSCPFTIGNPENVTTLNIVNMLRHKSIVENTK
ncbi:hypothetical protein GCM10011384_12980 [Psychrobacillus lasiicapitis]|nr:hypothetical protein GCM10011384_12980 [Psychrobacillus lasiicapitis]